MKYCVFIFFLSVSICSHAQFVWENRTYYPLIKTVLLEQQGNQMSEPVLYLNSNKKLLLQFDELTEQTNNYEYTIIHCNADWTQSNLEVTLYLEGFEIQPIENYSNSLNTLQRYVHYSQIIPSPNMKITKSGNYIIKVFKAGNDDEVIFSRRFYCVDDQTNIRTEIKKSLITSLLQTNQEVNVRVASKGTRFFSNAENDIKVIVQQNGREDNKRRLRMRGNSGSDMDFSFDESNCFWGGNEFRNFDITSLRSRSNYVARLDYYNNQNIAILRTERVKKTYAYSFDKDINGKYYIRNEYQEDRNTYSDYAWVYFTLDLPFNLEGDYYVVGDLTDWRMEPINKFEFKDGKYIVALYLKQGYYNYQILFLPNFSSEGSTAEVEGNHYETNNIYKIFVYYHNFSDDYDELVGYSLVEKS